jgi:Protein phosphatase inhibitor 2 (IPP-2)
MSGKGRRPDAVTSDVRDCLLPDGAERESLTEALVDDEEDEVTDPTTTASGAEPRASKKKPRLQWDEQNLLSNALEKERNAYPKIDEPKTPYHAMSGSEGGSSSSSAPQSPGSPAFLPRDQLVGFADLERNSSRISSDGNSRSVHISEDPGASSGGESSPRSREEFEAKRKQHYRDEFHKFVDVDADDEDGVEGGDAPDIIAAQEVSGATASGRISADVNSDLINHVEIDGCGNECEKGEALPSVVDGSPETCTTGSDAAKSSNGFDVPQRGKQ